MQGVEKLVLGRVYNVTTQFGSHKAKVLLFDEIEVLYDEWYKEAKSWLFDKFRGKGYYSRTSFEFFVRSSELVQVEPLSDKELRKHRPDLPLRIGRLENVSWTNQLIESPQAYGEYLKKMGVTFSHNIQLNSTEVVLYPYGPKGAIKKGEIVKANNGENFTTTELLWYSHNIQAKHVKEKSKGIGLYRLGIEKGLQSYYIGEFFDKAGSILYNSK